MDSRNTDKRQQKGDETYTRILASAIDLIAEEGIGGISASKLSDRSAVSKSTIFHHFKTIQEIPEAVLQLIFNQLLDPIEDAKEDDLAAFLNELGVCFIQTLEEKVNIYKTFFSFYNESMFHKEYQRYIGDFLAKSKDSLAHKFQTLAEMPLSEQEADQYAALILATLDGIGMHILIGGERERYIRAWELQVSLICDRRERL